MSQPPLRAGGAGRLLSLGWLTGERIVIYGSLVLALYGAILFAGILWGPNRAPMADFAAFHAAARLAWAGEAAAAYDWTLLQPWVAQSVGIPPGSAAGALGWLNPPYFFFVVLPFGLLPYDLAWTAWIVASVALFSFSVRAVIPHGAAAVAGLATAPALITLGVGQNGLVTASLFALALGLMDRKPVAAGIALGLLTFKPQLGVLFPLVLALTGRWRVFLSAAATTLVLVLLSWAAFGGQSWMAFLGVFTEAGQRYLSDVSGVLPRIQSVYAFLLSATGDRPLAGIAQAAASAAVIAIVLRFWLRRPEGPEEARAAALAAGALLISPYVWTYDSPVLIVAALFLARGGLRYGFLPGEKALLILICAWPGIAVLHPHSLIVPAALAGLLFLAWRRDRVWRISLARCGTRSAGT